MRALPSFVYLNANAERQKEETQTVHGGSSLGILDEIKAHNIDF
jgi:hypothetical protein